MAAPGQICPACRAGQVVYRERSAHGPFLGCSNYPACRAAWRLDGSRLSGWGGPTSGRSGPMPSRRNARRILAIAALVIVAAILAGRVLPELLGR
ncbi:MAG TPA: topoisomerase DNA-binding C4 zinc finger domain-containing protein [Actinomycetes bacterium]|nr:topoisomerase DNA-binding C4 zinc finger domain-containing protein [Actinomycetes bacterium]